MNTKAFMPRAEPSQEKSNRELMVEVLRTVNPALDVNDDNAVFGMLIDEYADYARLLTREMAEKLPQPEPTEPPDILTDGLPHLGGGAAPSSTYPTIFDIALAP